MIQSSGFRFLLSFVGVDDCQSCRTPLHFADRGGTMGLKFVRWEALAQAHAGTLTDVVDIIRRNG